MSKEKYEKYMNDLITSASDEIKENGLKNIDKLLTQEFNCLVDEISNDKLYTEENKSIDEAYDILDVFILNMFCSSPPRTLVLNKLAEIRKMSKALLVTLEKE